MEPSLYIHIPFCKRKCVYCDFYSTIYNEKIAADYIDVILKEAEGLTITPSTIYIGGGTPTALDARLLARLLKGLARYSRNASEFTFEANPESLDDEKIKLLLDCGANRLSIGVQSLNEQKLKKLGRIHNVQRAEEAVHRASKRGFKNIGVDLIFGVWNETPEGWKKELEAIVRLPITHISCYSLTYEKHTPLFQALEQKSLVPLDDTVVAAMYECAIDILSLRGFKQYEVSNFAKEGYACAHNLNYWDNSPYVGLGTSAVSYIDGTRSKNVSDVADYIRRFDEGKPLIASSETLTPLRRAKETAAVKIRTRDGIDFAWFKAKTGFDFLELEKKALATLLEKDLIKYTKESNRPTGICLKRKGFLFCDTVSSELL